MFGGMAINVKGDKVMFEVEFLNGKTGEFKKFQFNNIDWRSVASECFRLQHVLREKHGGKWTFLRMEWVS